MFIWNQFNVNECTRSMVEHCLRWHQDDFPEGRVLAMCLLKKRLLLARFYILGWAKGRSKIVFFAWAAISLEIDTYLCAATAQDYYTCSSIHYQLVKGFFHLAHWSNKFGGFLLVQSWRVRLVDTMVKSCLVCHIFSLPLIPILLWHGIS